MRSISTRRIPWMIMCAIAFHFWWGLMLIIEPSVRNITGIATMGQLFGSIHVEAVALITCSLLALVSSILGRIHWGWSLAVIMPQQFLLWISLVGIIVASINGRYPDGYIPHAGGLFISTDQAALAMISIFHTFAVIDHHILRRMT